MQKFFTKTNEVVVNIQKIIMIVSSVLILLGLVTTVVLRYIFQADLLGLEELILIPTFWMYFIGASYGTHINSHISADLTNVYIKNEKLKLYIKLFGSIVSLIISAIFTYWAIAFIQWTIESGATSNVWNYPLYIPQGAILIGFILITIYTFLSVMKDFNNITQLKK